MNSNEFVYWLKGFLTATDLLPVTTQQEAWKLIKEELTRVTNPNSEIVTSTGSSIITTNKPYDPSLTQLNNGFYTTSTSTAGTIEPKRQKVL